MEWVSRVTSVALEMVAPVLIGYWVDNRVGTKVVFTALGGALGLTIGIWSLVRMSKSMRDNSGQSR
jgi:F0F1-type ATP synthase assembly protein I